MVPWCNSVVLLRPVTIQIENGKEKKNKTKTTTQTTTTTKKTPHKKYEENTEENFSFIYCFCRNKITHTNQTVIGIRLSLLMQSSFFFRQLLPSNIIRKARVVLDWFLCLFCPYILPLNYLIITQSEINLICVRHS